jgi:hypothetical protein
MIELHFPLWFWGQTLISSFFRDGLRVKTIGKTKPKETTAFIENILLTAPF